MSRILLCCVLSLFVSSALAENVLMLVTPRNAPEVVAGAHVFLEQHDQDVTLNIRTTDQWLDMSDSDRQQLLQHSQTVFAAGVFGESAQRFLHDIEAVPPQNLIALHSEQRLVMASRLGKRPLLVSASLEKLMLHPELEQTPAQWMSQMLSNHPEQAAWLTARFFWMGRNSENMTGLAAYLYHLSRDEPTTEQPQLAARVRLYSDKQLLTPSQFDFSAKPKWVVLLDYETGERPGERALLDAVCDKVAIKELGCVALLTAWGEASLEAVKLLTEHKSQISSVVSLQDFVVGGAEQREAVTRLLKQLDVPVINAMRLTDSTESEWLLSEAGIKWDSVHYRVAMPELQGISQPMVVATMTPAKTDPITGARLAFSEPVSNQVDLLSRRLQRWHALQTKNNADKQVAIIYYNHPPGRHNIGADNLNVVESLFDILQQLKQAGYQTGELPKTSAELLDQLQDRGVNLPEDAGALTAIVDKVTTVKAETYQQWFEQLPSSLQQEMVNGPLGLLDASLQQAKALNDPTIAQQLLERVMDDLRHVVDGASHRGRDRVLDLLSQLAEIYEQPLEQIDWQAAEKRIKAINEQQIEGLRGWGEAPGKVMVHNNKILLPGLRFGKVFIGPQPPRGWELNEELLHANLSFPPPHQYMALYQWLRHDFNADAIIHLGRHSTYEFLPRHRVGLAENDYPQALLDDLPSIYPYIVDGVGEGIQAKRRGLAVIIDHLTPPLARTALYDQLLSLRQLVESYEAAPVNAVAMRQRAIEEMKKLLAELNLQDELTASMSAELEVRGLHSLEEVEDELLVHEIGHYLTHLQEDFMPLGLHIFGRDWSDEAVETMLSSMDDDSIDEAELKALLSGSPHAEMSALMNALAGHFVEPGKGNDPIRTPSALPTGRNFYALDDSLIPSKLGYEVGVELAQKARQQTQAEDTGSDALVLWASDVVRDEGAMIAFAYDMLGVKPVWNSRGIFKGLERLDLSQQQADSPRIRRDMLLTTSGLFRDLYGSQLVWLEQAVLMALDASSGLIRERYPALNDALDAALAPLMTESELGFEALEINQLAARWVEDARQALAQGVSAKQAGEQASYRLFGVPVGAYGAGVNRLVERSGAWQQRQEVANTYLLRMAHAYGADLNGQALPDSFKQRLQSVSQTYLGRGSNLYGVMDNNDAFDYLGGLSLAVETLQGTAPENYILAHSDSQNLAVEPLETVLLSELRGRYLNPQWLKPLMQQGYAGARTMGNEFLEYLWGWQVTNPGIVKSWVWDEVKRVYVDDGLNIGLDDFLEQTHNVHVKSNMLAIMLVAAYKDFWQADEDTIKSLATTLTELVLVNGLPGSGHTTPSHPMFGWMMTYLDEPHQQQLQAVLEAAQMPAEVTEASPSHITEIDLAKHTENKTADTSTDAETTANEPVDYQWLWWVLLMFALVAIGIWRGRMVPSSNKQES